MSALAPVQKPEKIQLGSWCPMSCAAPLVSCYIKQLSKHHVIVERKENPDRETNSTVCTKQLCLSTAQQLDYNPPAWYTG